MEHLQTKKRHDLLPLIRFLSSATFDLQTDHQLWHFLIRVFEKKYDPAHVARAALKLFGVWDENALCAQCAKSPIHVFHIQQEKFFCNSCASQFHLQDVFPLA